MFSPQDFHHEMARFRRQMDHLFHDFDRSFPFSLERDLFFPWDQPMLQDVNRQRMPLDAAAASREQKESGEQKYAAIGTAADAGTSTGPVQSDSNQMAVESSTPPTAAPAGNDATAIAQHSSRPKGGALRPWAPFSHLSALNSVAVPRMDVVEKENHFLVNCDLPGMSKEDVKVSVTPDGRLDISAEHSEEHEQKDDSAKYHRVERSYGKFKRSLQLPETVDADAVTARHENGLLKLTLPKKPKQEPKPVKQISIN